MRKDFENCIEEAKKGKRIITLPFKGAIDLIDKNLLDSETVKFVMGCNIGVYTKSEALNIQPFNFKNKKAGILIITTKRILHCFQLLFNNKIEEMNLEHINNIESKGNFLSSVLRIQSITNIMEIDIRGNLVTEVTKLLHELKDQGKNIPSQTINAVSEADELAKFKKLLDDGILTQEEFDKKKAQLLGI